MNLYRTSPWFAAIVSIILILKGTITSMSATDLSVSALIIANIFPIILLYVSICLLKVKDKKSSLTTTSVLISIVAFLWLVSLIPGLPVIVAILIITVNFLLSITALLIINWYVGKTAGLIATVVILLIVFFFVGAYGSRVLSSQSSGMTSNQSK